MKDSKAFMAPSNLGDSLKNLSPDLLKAQSNNIDLCQGFQVQHTERTKGYLTK